MTTKTRTRIDRETLTITFEREIAAPAEAVFDAWTDPDQLSQWWDPTGTPLAACTIDLRPGGAFRFTMASLHAPPFEGVYERIERPSALVFVSQGAVGTVRLEGTAQRTQLTVTIRSPSAEHLEHFTRLGVAEGTARTIENLGERFER